MKAKAPVVHTPSITDRAASCSCGQWYGAIRRADEAQGEYTLRASDSFEAHKRLAMRSAPEQAEMFAEQEEMFR